MTITVRIQYKGEAARKLAAEEGKEIPADPPRYTEQMERALSHFSIPPPHNSRAIWKSGFILCNWNITRESVRGCFLCARAHIVTSLPILSSPHTSLTIPVSFRYHFPWCYSRTKRSVQRNPGKFVHVCPTRASKAGEILKN